MLRPQSYLILSLTTLALAGCGQLKKVDDMNANTAQMNETTAKMSASMEEMNKAIATTNQTSSAISATSNGIAASAFHTGGVIDSAQDAGRQGGSLDARTKQFDAIIGSKKVDVKIVSAGIYMQAFEYQLWNNRGIDATPNKLNELEFEAVNEFFPRVSTISHWDDIDPMALPTKPFAGDTTNQKASFNAIATELHRLNRIEEDTAEEANVSANSMFTLIANSLRAGKQVREGRARLEDFPAYVDRVLTFEDIAIKLLQARYQMLGLALLIETTPILNGLWEGFEYTSGLKKWNLDLSTLSQSKLRRYRLQFTYAERTEALLSEIGAPVKLHPSVAKIYSGMKITGQAKDMRNPDRMNDELNLLNAIKSYSANR